MSRTTHLLLDFDHVWRVMASKPGGWRRLEGYLACRPEVHVTFVTHLSLGEALARFTEHGDLFPDSWICNNGGSIHRLQSDGSYEADHAFGHGLELIRRESLGNGEEDDCNPSIAALYLGAKGWTPRPRIVVGDPRRSWDLLRIADREVQVNVGQRNLESAVLAGIRGAQEPPVVFGRPRPTAGARTTCPPMPGLTRATHGREGRLS